MVNMCMCISGGNMLYTLIYSNGNGGDDDDLGIDDRIIMEDCFDAPLYGYVANITLVDNTSCTLGRDCLSNRSCNTLEDVDGSPITNNITNDNNESLQCAINQNVLGRDTRDWFAIGWEGKLIWYISNFTFHCYIFDLISKPQLLVFAFCKKLFLQIVP